MVTANEPTFENMLTIFYSRILLWHPNTFFSLRPIVCQASFGSAKCHQPFLPLGCIDGFEVKVLLSWYGQVNSCGVSGMNYEKTTAHIRQRALHNDEENVVESQLPTIAK